MTTVCFDIDTQLDFLLPVGALAVPGAARVIPAVAALNRWAAASRHVVVSTMDAHTEDDPEFKVWPAHCVASTLGQRKPDETLLTPRVIVPPEPSSIDIAGARQILLEKRTLDCFTNTNLPALLERLQAQRYLVYGVVTEYCVRYAVEGLLRTGARVEIVTDAIETLKSEDGDAALDALAAQGAHRTTVAAVTAS